MSKIYKIFPGIGIARLGNSANDYFIGPEAPGIVPPPPYRDAEEKIKRQGARFRIYEYEVDQWGGATLQREVTADDATINWTVHLVNSKAAGKKFPPLKSTNRNAAYERQGLTIDAGSQMITGKNSSVGPLQGDITFTKTRINEGSAQVKLGALKTDEAGRLIVLGGHGQSASPLGCDLDNFANNDGWYDDVSDGPVTATVTIDGTTVNAISAWVVVAAPAYAPGIYNMMTWYDQAVSVNASFFHPIRQLDRPSFTKDIYPILKRTVFLQWVSMPARRGHGNNTGGDFLVPDKLAKLSNNSDQYKPDRESVFNRLANPDNPRRDMPDLRSGVNPSNPSRRIDTSLTEHQYRMMTKWKDGDFESDWSGSEPTPIPFDNLPLAEQPDALTQAALEGCIGGPFFPGIETTYLMTLAETYSEPFRIDPAHPPGYLTEPMALPWQADFLACGRLWWPAQRPVSVRANGSFQDYSRGIRDFSGMVRHWSDLGFIVQDGDEYVERERRPIG